MSFEFDPAKNEANVRSRGLSFERVKDFGFDKAIVWIDSRQADAETRYVALGLLDRRLHVMCFASVEGGIRVISFRKANAREVEHYKKVHAAG